MRCYQFQALREYGGETGPVWGRRGEREIEEGFLLETVFEPGPEGSTGSRQSENGTGGTCTKPSVGRKAWHGGNWQLGLRGMRGMGGVTEQFHRHCVLTVVGARRDF